MAHSEFNFSMIFVFVKSGHLKSNRNRLVKKKGRQCNQEELKRKITNTRSWSKIVLCSPYITHGIMNKWRRSLTAVSNHSKGFYFCRNPYYQTKALFCHPLWSFHMHTTECICNIMSMLPRQDSGIGVFNAQVPRLKHDILVVSTVHMCYTFQGSVIWLFTVYTFTPTMCTTCLCL